MNLEYESLYERIAERFMRPPMGAVILRHCPECDGMKPRGEFRRRMRNHVEVRVCRACQPRRDVSLICPNGHLYAEVRIRIDANGHRRCGACACARNQRYVERRRAQRQRQR